MGPSRRVVIDDTDSRIRYSGQGWFQDQGSQDNVGNFGPTYKHTSHGTNGNDSLSFTFQGTSIRVVGTTRLSKISETQWDPGWECFVDNVSIGATKPFQFPENNWPLCEKSVLDDGEHEITINITSIGATFWFDYLAYTPSPAVSFDQAVLLVDSSDPGIRLDSSWRALGSTANFTSAKGSQARFDFIGTSITWVGFVPTEFPHGAASGIYSIDGGAPTTFKLNGLSPTSITVYNQAFFTTPDLAPGPHSLLVTYDGASSPATPLTLDYLFVTNTSLPQPTNTSLPQPSFAGATASLSPSASHASPTGNTSHQNSSGAPIGAIVGGVVGGLAVIALLLFLLWWWRRRRYRTILVGSSTGNGPNERAHEVTPFMATHPSGQSTKYAIQPTLSESSGTSQSPYVSPFHSHTPSHSQTQLSSSNGYPSSSNTNNIPHAHAAQAFPQTHAQNTSLDSSDLSGYAPGTVAQTRAIRKGQQVAPSQPTVTAVRHHDSGIRLPRNDGRVVVEDIPPLYTAT